jgi:ABC-type nickel/cobalt efflux system permease component RcnA
MIKNILLFCLSAVILNAHPMGNFSVSHYAKLQPSTKGVELEYVLDLAEIPTFQMLRDWNMDRNAPQAILENHATAQARLWLRNVHITLDRTPVHPKIESVKAVIADGAGNLPILRITTYAHIDAHGGKLAYDDQNYAERAGWKEIVVAPGNGATLRQASQTDSDLSQGLTHYPPDPTVAPPQDLRAEIVWSTPVAPAPVVVSAAKPLIQQIAQPHLAPAAPAPATLTAKNAPAGAVTRGDYLSRFLHERTLTPWMILVALGVAFILGSAHAFTPGHGKTIVAAYLVGSRGTLKHAAFLGAMVTFTHTIVVFALGLVTLFLFNYVVPERITEILGALSGVSIAVIGGWMLYKRLHTPSQVHHHHGHDHHHHDHEHAHAHGDHHHHDHTHADHHHDHDHGHTHDHDHAHIAHSHGIGHSHSHVPDEISWKGLVALGASGGLVPCESALVLLLGAIALGRVGLGLLLLLSFSLGLAIVLMAIGVAVLYAKNLIPESKRSSSHPLIRWASIASPAVVLIIGILMTAVSLGWIQPKWMIG